LSSGTANDITDPVNKVTRYDLLTHPFRFDQEKIEGLALGGGSLWVVNDNDGGEALNFFLELNPSVLGGVTVPSIPGQENVLINEVNSNGSEADFVELINTGTSSVDLSGWRITDVDTARGYVVPQGTTIGSGEILVFQDGVDGVELPGLGGSDSTSLITRYDVTIDSFAWTAHVASANRCPTDLGIAFIPNAASPGTANTCAPPVVAGADSIVVNEVASQDDFVELYNLGTIAVDVSGWQVRDNDPGHNPVVLPPGTTMDPGAFLVIDDEASGARYVLGFGLGSGDSATLYDAYGFVVDTYSWTSHVQSHSRCPDGTGSFIETSGTNRTEGGANSCP
jgi:hypothetical protein